MTTTTFSNPQPTRPFRLRKRAQAATISVVLAFALLLGGGAGPWLQVGRAQETVAEPTAAALAPSDGSPGEAAAQAPSTQQIEAPAAEPAPSPAPIPGGPTDLQTDLAATAEPNQEVAYRHTAVHLAGELPDAKEITAVSSLGWRIDLRAADGVQPLFDSNGNGLPDTGPLPVGGWVEIVVVVTVPSDAAEGTQDVTTVTASSAGAPAPSNTDIATNVTTVVLPPPTPTLEPTQPAPTSTPTTEPSPTGAPDDATTTAEATPDETAGATPSAEPSATPTPEPLVVSLSAGESEVADPGEVVEYRHTISAVDGEPAVINVTATSSLGWSVALRAADGLSPLADTNGDGINDVGTLASGETKEVVVRVTIPHDAAADAQDITTVTAEPATSPVEDATNGDEPSTEAADDSEPEDGGSLAQTVAQLGGQVGFGFITGMIPRASETNEDDDPGDTAVNTTRVMRKAEVEIETHGGGFGNVAPDGRVTDASVTSVVDMYGATYVRANAMTIEVETNGNVPWTVSCGLVEMTAVGPGPLEWRIAGDEEWHAFGTPGTVCLTGSGDTTITIDFRLRVDWSDPVGGIVWEFDYKVAVDARS